MKRVYVAHPRHPVTGRQIRISAPTPRALAAMMATIDTYRRELRIGARSAEEVSRALARMRRGPCTLYLATVLYLRRTDLSEHTRRRVQTWLIGLAAELATRELEQLDGPTCAAWLVRLRAHQAPSSVGLAWRTLRAVVRYAAERGLMDRAPWGPWRPSARLVSSARTREPRECCRTLEELERLLDACLIVGAEDLWAKCSLSARAGLRNGELARLRWTDLHGGLRIAPSKGRAAICIELPMMATGALGFYRNALIERGLYDPDGPIFPCTRAPGRGAGIDARALRRAVAQAGLPRPELWSPHSLRDTFCLFAARECRGDLGELLARTRHASVASLARYLRPAARPSASAVGAEPPTPLLNAGPAPISDRR